MFSNDYADSITIFRHYQLIFKELKFGGAEGNRTLIRTLPVFHPAVE